MECGGGSIELSYIGVTSGAVMWERYAIIVFKAVTSHDVLAHKKALKTDQYKIVLPLLNLAHRV